MNVTNLPGFEKYCGKALHSRFAFKTFRDDVKPTGNIIGFIAPAEVEAEGMIDQEDVLNGAFIYSEKMIHFLFEIPIVGDSQFGAVSFQRLFCHEVGRLLEKTLNVSIVMDGDDILTIKDGRKRKYSVSIVHCKDGAALGHLGINIVPGSKAPDFAIGTDFNESQTLNFMKEVYELFYNMTKDIFIATTKILS